MPHPRITFPLSGLLLLASWVRAGEVEITTDALVYEPGQSIVVTVSNSTDSTLIMYCDPPLWIESVDSGEQAGPCGCVTWILELPSGETRMETVPQLDCDTSEPQPWLPGMYQATLPYQLGTDPSSQNTATSLLCIGPGCASTAVESEMKSFSWGQAKARYSPHSSTGH